MTTGMICIQAWSWLSTGHRSRTSRVGTYINMARAVAATYPSHVIKLIDDTGKILYASASHSDVLGYEPKVLIGMELRRVIARDDIPHSDLSIQDAVLGGQTTEIGFRHRKADGSYVYMRRKTRGLKGDNASRYYVMTRSSLRSA